jgi:hypothetical protein
MPADAAAPHPTRPHRRTANFPQKFPVIGLISLLIDFLGSASGPVLARNPRNSGVSGQIPVKLTGNFFPRNREYDSVEQGIQFHGTGNTIPRNREYETQEQGKAHRRTRHFVRGTANGTLFWPAGRGYERPERGCRTLFRSFPGWWRGIRLPPNA